MDIDKPPKASSNSSPPFAFAAPLQFLLRKLSFLKELGQSLNPRCLSSARYLSSARWISRGILLFIFVWIFVAINRDSAEDLPSTTWLDAIIGELSLVPPQARSLTASGEAKGETSPAVSFSLAISDGAQPQAASSDPASQSQKSSSEASYGPRKFFFHSDAGRERCARLLGLVGAAHFFDTEQVSAPEPNDPLVSVEIVHGSERHVHSTLLSLVSHQIAFQNLLALLEVYAAESRSEENKNGVVSSGTPPSP